MPELKLLAFDAEDLAVISANLQDALLRVADLAWLPAERRFVAVSNRFDWVEALQGGDTGDAATYLRRRSGLRFERVLGAQISGIDLKRKGAILSLLAVGFEPSEPPAGKVMLRFADGGAIRLDVECIEAELKDLGPVWRATSMPKHGSTNPRVQEK
jgi:hypothetical protein